MTESFTRVAEQIQRIATIDRGEALDICLSHFNCLVGMISASSDSDEEFMDKMAALTSQAIAHQVVHRAKLRAAGII